MANRVLMPKGSDTMTEGKILKWIKKEGDAIVSGDAIAEIETDKVNMEVEAVAAGILRKILVQEGSMVPVGQLIAVIAGAQEDISALLNGGGKKAEAAAPATPEVHAPAPAGGPQKPRTASKAHRVLMPKGSDTMTEGKILKWLKQEGEKVTSGDALVEIETDKVNMEVEAVADGTLRKILVSAGGKALVGDLIAILAGPNEDISALLVPAEPPKAEAAHPAAPAPAAAQVAVGGTLPPPPIGGGRVLASPLARRIAKEAGLDISSIFGSGPGGRIIRSDVEKAVANRQAGAYVPLSVRAAGPAVPTSGLAQPAGRPIPAGGPEFQDEPLSSMRKVIATRLPQSLGPVPHIFLTIEADMRRAKELRESANNLDATLKLSYNDIVLKAVAAALRWHGEVNVSFQGDTVRYHNRVHLGMAVATDDGGLITPVIRDADRKSLQQVSREAKEMAGRARKKKLKPEEYTGSTFSVSNLGMLGIEEFTAIINPPEAAILAVGAVEEKPVAENGRVETGFRCRLTLSCDHRVIDGATGARFLQTLKRILENPVYLAF
jgi:pyruvate dehydrogenase E2 component (dihydrolipoyllysine-residue acetyltransferase)